MYHARERVEQEFTRSSKSSNTYACGEFRRIPWTITIGFESAVPSSPVTGILGMPTCGATLKPSSSYFDEVCVISSCSSLDTESIMRLRVWTSVWVSD